MTTNPEIAIQVSNATKRYGTDAQTIPALHHVTLSVCRGEVCVITGPSGSGKSTLLHAIGGLERLDEGSIQVADIDVGALRATELAAFRRSTIGFVFQFFHLIPTLSAVENVAMPLVLDGVTAREADERAASMLEEVGLGQHGARFAAQLSGGQLQRVAIARALVNEPAVVLADEPTGSLDRQSGREINELMRQLVSQHGVALVIVTHDPSLSQHDDRQFEMVDGTLVEA